MSPPRKTQAPIFLLMVVALAFSLAAPAIAAPAAAPQNLLVCTTPVFVNEFHYDNDGTDVGEFIEVAGPAGTDLTGWSLELYNGNGGGSYGTIALSGALPDEGGSGYGTAFVAAPGLQNGSPDGFALVDAGNVVQQFLSYEGTFTAVGGPADGMTSTDVGVSEPGDTPVGQSLQLIGSGECPEDFTWTGPVAESPGTVNAGQTFVPGTPTARVVINEFAPKGTEWIELYNAGTAAQDLTGWSLSNTANSQPLAGTIDPGTFITVTSSLSLDNSGDFIQLNDPAEAVVDRVGYGIGGNAPIAPFASNGPQYSTARVVDGGDSGDDAADWNLDPTPTPGAPNDVAANNLGGSLIINEIQPFPPSGNDFIELYNAGGAPVDVSGWLVSDGDDVGIINAGLSVPAGGFLALEETVDFTTEGTTGIDFGGTDVAYLFEPTRVRIDQLGWNGEFLDDCAARVPNGAGPNSGYNWASSGGGVTLFDQPCTLGSSNYTPPVSDWVINEIHADPDAANGDANGDGVVDTSQDEFLEIVNNSGAPVDISGWTISDAVAVRHTFPAGTVIADQCSVVVFGGGTPTGDFGFSVVQTASEGFLGLNNGGDDVILADLTATTVVSYTYGAEGGNNQSLTRDPDITGPDPLIQHTTATGSGGALFSPGTQIDGTPFAGCLAVCGAPATLIHEIQGDGLASPLVGQQHAVEALVVADLQDVSSIRGFYLEEPDGEHDGNPATSEGVFVYDNNFGVDVAVGDVVRVLGTVSEYNQETQLGTITSVELCPRQPLAVTPLTVTLPFTDTTFPERFEGMAVALSQDLTVSENYNLGRGGILTLSNGRLQQPTNVVLPGAPANALQEENNRNQIILDDGNLAQNPDPILYPPPELTALNSVRSGDLVGGIVGVLAEGTSGWSSGGIAYRVHPYAVPNFIFANPRPVAPDPVRAGGSLKVSSFNVLNYFLTLDDGVNDICGPDQNMECRGADSALEFTRQRDKLLQALYTLNADVVGLMELENTPGVEPLQDIVDGLNALAGAGTYDFIDAGTFVPGDVIKVGLIYKPGVVQPVGDFAILNSLVDPNFNTDLHRPALAQTFQELATNGRFTVIVNHLKSKGCGGATGLDQDQGDGQSCFNYARTLGANALVNWALSDPTGTGDPDFLITGDLNSYAKEDPIAALETAGYTNLETLFVGPDAYSYVYFAQAGSLDHSMSNASLTPQVSGATTWHINADEPSVLDYNVEFKSANHVNLLYNADPFRTSDHDPVLVGLNLAPVDASIRITKTVGTDAGVCATTNDITVPAGTDVYYCYAVANTGNLTLNVHDLDDSELGSIFAAFPYALTPGSSVNTVAAGLEISTTIDATTANDALWTAYNVGPIDVVTATATATVTVLPPNIFVDPLSLATSQEPDTVVVETLSISNTGGLDLDWIIDEEPTMAAAPTWPAPEPVERIDSAAAMEAEMTGQEDAAPMVSAPRDPAAAARAQRMLLATGLLLVPDSTNDRVMALDPATGDLVDPDFVPADPDHLSTPKNAILNASGDTILVSDQLDDVVQAYALDGSYIGVFAPAGGANNAILDNITGIDLKPNGNLLVSVQSGANADSVAEFDTGGNYLGNFIANGSGGLDGPFDVYPRTADWLVSSITSDQVLRYDLAGAFIASLAPINNFPQQVAGAATSNLLIGNFGGTQEGVVELTAAGAVVGIYDPPTLGGYRGAYELPNGNILTTNGAGVHEIDRSGNLVQTKIGGVSAQYIEYVEPAAGCTNLADIPWVSVDPISGTTPSGLATTVQVSFDSTGLAVGDYTGNLCIFSNDPDAGPGNETGLVIVPLRMSVTSPTAVTLAALAASSESPAPVPAGLPVAALPAATALALAAAAWLRRRR